MTLSIIVDHNSVTPNKPPVFAKAIDSLLVEENKSAAWTASATDPDGDSITYTVDQIPSWITVSGAELTIQPSDSDNTILVNVFAEDKKGGKDTCLLTITVEHPVAAILPAQKNDQYIFSLPKLGISYISGKHKIDRIDIVNLSGKTIRSLSVSADTISWDGRDNSGNKMSAGVYAARLFSGSKRIAVKRFVNANSVPE